MQIRGRGIRRTFTRAGLCLAALLGLGVLAAPAQAADGTWERAWGKNVNGGGVFEVCIVASDCLQGAQGPLAGEFNNPQGLAVDQAGDVYVADASNSRIQKFDSSGQFLLSWGKDVTASGPGDTGTGAELCLASRGDVCKIGVPGGLGGEFLGPWDVEVGPDGKIFVVDAPSNRVQRFASDTTFERAWGQDVTASGLGNTGNDFERCIAAVADVCKSGLPGPLAGELDSPRAISVDASGKVYVADITNHRIQAYSSDGDFERTWGKDVIAPGSGDTGTGAEVCVGFTMLCKAGVAGPLGGELTSPIGIDARADGTVYVVSNTPRVDVFDTLGNWQRNWGKDVVTGAPTGFEVCTVAADCKLAAGTTGKGGEMSAVRQVATDPAGNVYIAENAMANGSRVQKFGPAGSFLAAWGKNVNGGGVFGVCTVAADCLAGTAGSLGGELDHPYGVAAGPQGELYVTDETIDRVQKFAADPPAVPADPPAKPGPTGQRAAALKKCKKLAKKKRLSKKARKKCLRKARKRPL
jgi:DNA-binding beta-propeller fold protein YncE